ncbi:hypothetical protein RC77_05500 [Pectobacterium brasiliense]|uniref:hypothetical protein n=1 Tax=Pectobacterium brasiliense TaxID=180957 RepID=UPI00057D3CAB|nr:hypothetical protein [Pectobacterium brasiliense]KHS70967.1 hypothetical protein RC77_05500 [Pectobacterium brasiliense]
MQFSDLTKMVQDIWSFAWPPIAICSVAYFMARYFHPVGTNNLLRKTVIRAKEYSKKLESVRVILEPYGLTKLVPAISMVVLVSCMFLLNGPITNIVDSIPPYVYYQPDILITKTMSETQQLALIRKYSMTRSLGEAYYLALENARLESKTKSTYDSVMIWYQAQELLKFALIFAIIMFFVGLKAGLPIVRQIVKMLLMSTLLAFLWIISLASLLYQQEQVLYDESKPVILSLEKDAPSLLALPITDEEREKLSPAWNIRDQRWWQIYLFDPHRLEWMQKTFSPHDPHKRR